MAKQCERCGDIAIVSERYCKGCRKLVLAELKEAKYLTTAPWIGFNNRELDKRENTYETKNGRD